VARILVIDDDDEIRHMVKEMLVGAGHEIVEAPNGLHGARIFREEPTDLVITDIFMPGKEGLQTIMELSRDFPEVKIIAMSGGAAAMSSSATLFLAGQPGAGRTIPKPITKAELLAAVNDLLSRG
jgi:DNA-binding response OmpR family regulator